MRLNAEVKQHGCMAEDKYNNDNKKAVTDLGYSMTFTINKGYADRNDNSEELNRICIDYTFKPNNLFNAVRNLKNNTNIKKKILQNVQ